MAIINVPQTDTFDEWRTKTNDVSAGVGDIDTLVQNAALTFSSVAINYASSTTSGVNADFDVNLDAGVLSLGTVNNAGIGYLVGDELTVLGSEIGGVDGIHDQVLTITAITQSAGVEEVTFTGTVPNDLIKEVNYLRAQAGTEVLSTSAQTVSEAINELDLKQGQDTLTTTADTLTGAVNELDAELGTITDTAMGTTATTVSGAIAEHEAQIGNISYGTTAQTLTGAIKELDDLQGNVTMGTAATTVTGAIKEHEDQIGNVDITGIATSNNTVTGALSQLHTEVGSLSLTAQGTSADHPLTVTYVNLGSDLTSAANNLKGKVDFLADQVGGTMSDDYEGTDNNIITALNNLYAASSITTLNDVYLRRDTQDWVSSGTFRLGQEGIAGGYSEDSEGVVTTHDLLIKTYDSSDNLQTRITVKDGTGNVGIGGAAGTTKVKVTGSVNATTGYQWNGTSIDNRYLMQASGTAQNVATNTTFTGNLTSTGNFTFTPSAGDTFTIGSTVIASDTLTIGEWVQDTVGAMLSGNTESGISVDYDDANNKINFNVNDPVITLSGDVTGSATMTNLGNTNITVSVLDDSHNHVTSNIDGLFEYIQDTVGGMVTGNTEDGITVTYDDANDEFDFVNTDKGSSQNIFKNVKAQSNTAVDYGTAVADSNNDTLIIREAQVSSTNGIKLGYTSDDIITIAHADTSSVANHSNNNSNGVVIQDLSVSFDTYGHVTAISSSDVDLDNRYSQVAFKTLTVDDTDTEYTWADTGSVVADAIADTLKLVESDSVDIDVDASNDAIKWNVKASFIHSTINDMVDPVNTEAGISVDVDANNKLSFNVNDPLIKLTGDVTGQATMTNLGDVTIETTVASSGVAYSEISGVDAGVKAAVGTMVAGNTESGISVVYQSGDGTLDFTVSAATGNIQDGAVTNAKLGADAVNGSKIADDSIDSEHYVDGSIDNAHLADNCVTQAKIADDAVGSAELKSVVSLVIYNSAGTALKTIYGAGA